MRETKKDEKIFQRTITIPSVIRKLISREAKAAGKEL